MRPDLNREPIYGTATRKVLYHVEYQCGVTVERMMKGRTAADNRARHIAMWLLATTFALDTPRLMRIFGVSRVNIVSAINGTMRKRSVDSRFRRLTNMVEDTAKETFGLKRVMKPFSGNY